MTGVYTIPTFNEIVKCQSIPLTVRRAAEIALQQPQYDVSIDGRAGTSSGEEGESLLECTNRLFPSCLSR